MNQFGSSLHNCRLMRPGSLVVEIHAALKNDFGPGDDHMYAKLCGDLGMRWVGYAPLAPFRPIVNNDTVLADDGMLAEPPKKGVPHDYWWHWPVIDGASTKNIAHVLWPDESDFRAFVERLSRGEALATEYERRTSEHWEALAKEYKRRTSEHRDPRRLAKRHLL